MGPKTDIHQRILAVSLDVLSAMGSQYNKTILWNVCDVVQNPTLTSSPEPHPHKQSFNSKSFRESKETTHDMD